MDDILDAVATSKDVKRMSLALVLFMLFIRIMKGNPGLGDFVLIFGVTFAVFLYGIQILFKHLPKPKARVNYMFFRPQTATQETSTETAKETEVPAEATSLKNEPEQKSETLSNDTVLADAAKEAS